MTAANLIEVRLSLRMHTLDIRRRNSPDPAERKRCHVEIEGCAVELADNRIALSRQGIGPAILPPDSDGELRRIRRRMMRHKPHAARMARAEPMAELKGNHHAQ